MTECKINVSLVLRNQTNKKQKLYQNKFGYEFGNTISRDTYSDVLNVCLFVFPSLKHSNEQNLNLSILVFQDYSDEKDPKWTTDQNFLNSLFVIKCKMYLFKFYNLTKNHLPYVLNLYGYVNAFHVKFKKYNSSNTMIRVGLKKHLHTTLQRSKLRFTKKKKNRYLYGENV